MVIFGNFSVTYFVFSITITERLLIFLFGITTAGSKKTYFVFLTSSVS